MSRTKMRRRPIDVPGASPRQAIWSAIRRMDGPFELPDIVGKTDAHPKTVLDYLTALSASGHLGREGTGKAAIYRLVRDTGQEAPKVRPDGSTSSAGRGSENMWRAMRTLAEFSPADIAVHATAGDVVVSEAVAKAYCRMLLATEYLRVVRKAQPMRGCLAVYRLIRNSGPKAPMIQRVKRVYDPNTGEVFGAIGEEELA